MSRRAVSLRANSHVLLAVCSPKQQVHSEIRYLVSSVSWYMFVTSNVGVTARCFPAYGLPSPFPSDSKLVWMCLDLLLCASVLNYTYTYYTY